MSTVFVSYSREDRSKIDPLLTMIQDSKLSPWIDEHDILPTMEFNEQILVGLEASSWFLLAMTRNSSRSEYVKDELHWALTHRNGRIIPVLLEKCDPAMFHLRLLRLQYIDYTGTPETGATQLAETLNTVRVASAEESLRLHDTVLDTELEMISLLLTFVSRNHQRHLRNVLSDEQSGWQNYRGGHAVRHELRDLCTWGLLERCQGVFIGRVALDGQRFRLNKVIKPTPLGKRLAKHIS